MDWNGIVKVFGAYHGIECDEVETMEEADAQLCELYAKERPAITGKLITGAEWAEYQRLKAQKPTPTDKSAELAKRVREWSSDCYRRGPDGEPDGCLGLIGLEKILDEFEKEEGK